MLACLARDLRWLYASLNAFAVSAGRRLIAATETVSFSLDQGFGPRPSEDSFV